jgi:hypothetical protein
MIQLLSAVLHHPSRMGQHQQLIKESPFFIELIQKCKIFAPADAHGYFSVSAKFDLCLNIMDDMRQDGFLQCLVIVIIDVLTVFHKAQGANRNVIKVFVEGSRPTILLNSAINEIRR